jgi:hypothetical protein
MIRLRVAWHELRVLRILSYEDQTSFWDLTQCSLIYTDDSEDPATSTFRYSTETSVHVV